MSISGASGASQMDTVVMEHRLKQKLILMENAVARIANTKNQLNDNAEQVRNEVRCCVGHQLAYMRSREQQLLTSLDSIVSLKDRLLCEQQEQLHQAIGACQQGLQTLQTSIRRQSEVDTVADSVAGILHGLNSIEMRPRESSSIAFEADTMALRGNLLSFGRILASDNGLKTSESLPGDLEDYDDCTDFSLQHKSLFRNAQSLRIANPLNRPKLASDDQSRLLKSALSGHVERDYLESLLDDATCVRHHNPELFLGESNKKNNGKVVANDDQLMMRKWLGQIKNVVEPEPAVFEDFEIVRNRSTTIGSSVEIIDSSLASSETLNVTDRQLFAAVYNGIRNSSNDNWLLGKVNTANATAKTDFSKNSFTDRGGNIMGKVEANMKNISLKDENSQNLPDPGPANKRKRHISIDEICDEDMPRFAFGQVIDWIKSSDDSKWLLKSEKIDTKSKNQLISNVLKTESGIHCDAGEWNKNYSSTKEEGKAIVNENENLRIQQTVIVCLLK